MGDNLGPTLQRFHVASTNFVETVDSLSSLERDTFLASMGRCLAELYSSALYLPAVEPETTAVDETEFAAAPMGRTVQVNQGEDWSAGHLLDGL